jgi:hypothetical protein
MSPAGIPLPYKKGGRKSKKAAVAKASTPEPAEEPQLSEKELVMKELNASRVWDLRQFCLRTGVLHADCADKAALVQRSYEAVMKLHAQQKADAALSGP